MRLSRALVVACAVVGLSVAVGAESPLGLTIAVDGDGFVDPIVKKIIVTKVEPGSLSAGAGIVDGDEIVQVDGQSVQGRHAKELGSLLKFGPGQTRTLRLRRGGDQVIDVRLSK